MFIFGFVMFCKGTALVFYKQDVHWFLLVLIKFRHHEQFLAHTLRSWDTLTSKQGTLHGYVYYKWQKAVTSFTVFRFYSWISTKADICDCVPLLFAYKKSGTALLLFRLTRLSHCLLFRTSNTESTPICTITHTPSYSMYGYGYTHPEDIKMLQCLGRD